jgi:hypothetical protein
MNFLNFFIYLDDVTESHGPYWFVRGSHVNKPHDYWQDRRFLDAEVESAYASEDILCIAESLLFGAEFHLRERDPFEEQLKRASMTEPTYSRVLLRFGV